jgi:CheY-like chemotaxis protein
VKRRVRLVHWNAAEAAERAGRLRAVGYEAEAAPVDGPAALRELRESPPDAIVIDLSRLPSHGRDVALALRQSRATRHVPLVLVEGDPAKVERIRALLPDASYATWGRIATALRHAIERPPAEPVVPDSALAGYSGTPLPRKLGIGEGTRVALAGAPEGLRETLGELPGGAQVRDDLRGKPDLIIWFVRSRRELERDVDRYAARTERARLWIAWPKQASGVDTDVTQTAVRRAGLAKDLVDYKVCAIDATWSGLLFKRRER